MLQDLETTIKQFEQRAEANPIGDSLLPKLHKVVLEYGKEVVRDLKDTGNWRCQVDGLISAGYLLSLVGETEKGERLMQRGIQVYRKDSEQYFMEKYDQQNLELVISTIDEFEGNKTLLEELKTELAEMKKKQEETPEVLRRKIKHLEADLECQVGDLNGCNYRKEQGEQFQKLGEHAKAIEYFRMAMSEDGRDWRSETSLANRLLIVDSYLALGDGPAAVDEFMTLMTTLMPKEIKEGEKFPDEFSQHFEKFFPYFDRLGMSENVDNIRKYARARFDLLKTEIKPYQPKEKPKEHWNRSEISKLSEIIAECFIARGNYQEAVAIYDEGRNYLQYKHHLSRREQAEFAIRGGMTQKAFELARADEKDRDGSTSFDEKPVELVNLYLQLNDYDSASRILESDIKFHKGCGTNGSWDDIYEDRRLQIRLLGSMIGNNYVARFREYVKGKGGLIPETGMKFLTNGNMEEKDSK